MPSPNPNRPEFSMEDSPGGSPPPQVERPRKTKTGFYVPVNPDGSLDPARVRDPIMLERLKATLGEAAAPVEEKPKVPINRDFIPVAYSLLEVVIQRSGKMFLKWPPALAEEMVFSPEKKQALVEPTAALIEKYSPSWLIANQELAAFAMAFTDAVNDMVTKGAERYVAKMRASESVTINAQPVNGGVVAQ